MAACSLCAGLAAYWFSPSAVFVIVAGTGAVACEPPSDSLSSGGSALHLLRFDAITVQTSTFESARSQLFRFCYLE